MSTETFKRIKTELLYVPFYEKLKKLIEACEARGHYYVATSGVRTFDEQDALYAIGRTTGQLGHTVTKARGGDSPHNYALACDFSYDEDPDRPGLQLNDADENYRVLAEEAAKLGLVSGLTWNSPFLDPNHVQWPVKQIGMSWNDLKIVYKQGGYPAIFKLLDDWQEKHGTI